MKSTWTFGSSQSNRGEIYSGMLKKLNFTQLFRASTIVFNTSSDSLVQIYIWFPLICHWWHAEGVLTDKADQQQAGGVQLDAGVTEGFAEGGVDDHEEDGAADGAERGLLPFQKLPEETATHLRTTEQISWFRVQTLDQDFRTCAASYLTQDQRHHHRHEELREDGGEGNGGRGAELEEEEEKINKYKYYHKKCTNYWSYKKKLINGLTTPQ